MTGFFYWYPVRPKIMRLNHLRKLAKSPPVDKIVDLRRKETTKPHYVYNSCRRELITMAQKFYCRGIPLRTHRFGVTNSLLELNSGELDDPRECLEGRFDKQRRQLQDFE